jgi:peptidyl-tRNA hydrolase ICT1
MLSAALLRLSLCARLSRPALSCVLRQYPASTTPFSRSASIQAGDTEIEIPRNKVQLSFSRSSGAGGQNVNKVSTKCELRFHVASADWLDTHTKGRLLLLYRKIINNAGELVITSQKLRTQEGNLEDAFFKLQEAVKEAASIPKVRSYRA